LFDTAYYLQQNPEVMAAGLNPLAHFLERGTAAPDHASLRLGEGGARAFFAGGATAGGSGSGSLIPLSVVIPTHNRSSLLVETLEACRQQAGGCELDIIVIDAASTDDTRQRLSQLSATMPNLTWHSTLQRGLAKARNLGADAARHDVILFLSDDLRPGNPDFFRVHASLHSRYPNENLAVLGKVAWPRGGRGDSADSSRSAVHLEALAGAPFGRSPPIPYSFVGWPYFSTANVSVKKKLVADWLLDGFDADFGGAPSDDLEFAYRLSKTAQSFWIFYDPTSTGAPQHRCTLAAFMERQLGVGKALVHLIELHPELAATCHLQDFLDALNAPGSFPHDRLYGDYRLVMEGVKAWARALESEREMGTEPWHEDFLAAVLELCLLDGFVSAWPRPAGNLTAASALLLDRFCQRMHPSLHRELADWSFLVQGLVPQVDRTLLRPASSQP
jgi:glycosyltransferase involved in cell wall biosynthesis